MYPEAHEKVHVARREAHASEVLLQEEMQAMGYALEYDPAELSVRPWLRLKQWLREQRFRYRHRRDFG